jgi:flagellar motor switch protein FliN/FliY
MPIQELMGLAPGSVIDLDKLSGEPLDILLNGKLVARGEAVVVNERYGVRLVEIISAADRISGLGSD